MEYLKSVVPVIEANYKKFTNVEKTIADYFIHNQERGDFSARAVAERLYISEASLSRFAQKCGYRGYREFIYQYEETFEVRKDTMEGNTRTILNVYQELLNKSYSLVDEKQIEHISRMITRANRVYICGKGSSGLVAREVESRFMRIGVDIDSITDGDMMKMQTVFQDKGCLAIGISISGETEDILYFLQGARKRGARTILITAQKRESFEEFCDEVAVVPSLKYLNYGNVISPQFPILVLIDIIYSKYVAQNKNRTEGLHGSTLEALHAKKPLTNTGR